MLEAPTIAAVVGAYDSHFFHYPGCVRLQKHRDDKKQAIEMVRQIGHMIEERLGLYELKKSESLPERITYVRDGVSDGQYVQVITYELSQLIRA